MLVQLIELLYYFYTHCNVLDTDPCLVNVGLVGVGSVCELLHLVRLVCCWVN